MTIDNGEKIITRERTKKEGVHIQTNKMMRKEKKKRTYIDHIHTYLYLHRYVFINNEH